MSLEKTGSRGQGVDQRMHRVPSGPDQRVGDDATSVAKRDVLRRRAATRRLDARRVVGVTEARSAFKKAGLVARRRRSCGCPAFSFGCEAYSDACREFAQHRWLLR